MKTPRFAALVLPPAMTYLLAQAFDRARARRCAGASAVRLDGLMRDAVRYLLASGATLAEVHAAVRDVCEAQDAWQADPELRATLDALETRTRDFATASTTPAAEGRSAHARRPDGDRARA